jgi:hypothetical protein
MPGVVPGMNVFTSARKKDVDGRDTCAKTRFALLPGHDGRRLSLRISLAVASTIAHGLMF